MVITVPVHMSPNEKIVGESSICKIILQDKYIEFRDKYDYVNPDFKTCHVNALVRCKKANIDKVSLYWNDEHDGFFVSVDDNAVGFVDGDLAKKVFNIISDWIYED